MRIRYTSYYSLDDEQSERSQRTVDEFSRMSVAIDRRSETLNRHATRSITRVYCNDVRLARLIYRAVYTAEYGPNLYRTGDMLMQRDS